MRKQFEWSNALQTLENEYKEAHEAEETLREKYNALEEAHASLKTEKEALDKQLWEVKESLAAEQVEVSRLKTLLENERCKVAELETARRAQDKTDLEALLDVARQDKDRTDQKLADLVESLAFSQCELARLKESLTGKDQELAAVSSSAKTQIADLQFKLEVAESDKQNAEREVNLLREHIDQLAADCDSHLEAKQNLTSTLQEVQSELKNIKQQKQMMEAELHEISSRHNMESEEWKQFQRDLQTAVVIANNFSQETQEKMERLTVENAQVHEQMAALKVDFDKLLQENRILKQTSEDFSPRKHSILTNAEFKGKVLTTMDRELAALREGRPHLDQRSQSISVKSLIRSIEEQVKSGCSSIVSSHSESRRSSTSSEASLKDLAKPTSPQPTPDSPRSPTKEFNLRTSGFKTRSMERSPQPRHIPGSGVSGGITSPEGTGKGLQGSRVDGSESGGSKTTPQISSILKDRSTPRRGSGIIEVDACKKETLGRDPLSSLAKLMKGSKRNALLKWCQIKTIPYSNVDITNFSSSWIDGLGFCALLHSYVPERIPYSELTSEDKRKNLTIAFSAAESIGIKATLNINDMVSMERPDWQAVMNYVTAIYRHFEVDKP
ncbi:unnamed protein product [Candidula unifasciata]|uniref:Calponin-homology (CH) domain-containing protein n=1 Tax=Candidula unifasciata TaxID=100452 RepID=A0A8S3ZGA6_9EUPU|nr:unnamed protein product [Candidula unifasciata]